MRLISGFLHSSLQLFPLLHYCNYCAQVSEYLLLKLHYTITNQKINYLHFRVLIEAQSRYI